MNKYYYVVFIVQNIVRTKQIWAAKSTNEA